MCTSLDENDMASLRIHVNVDDTLKMLNDKVEALYRFRDHYFENRSIDEAKHKNQAVQKVLDDTLALLNEHQDLVVKAHRATFYYLKGKALNVLPHYSKEAEDFLSKAVKLDPKLVEAWNELGECYWKNDNIKEAENCFNGALNNGKNKVSLRNLSMTSRQKSVANAEEKRKIVEYGLSLAKEAVQLDPNDGLSWIILGNAHLSSFFGLSQSPKTLKLCLNAYIHAEKDIAAKSNPDLHYNKAITLKYQEEFEMALNSFNLASSYEPGWDPPKAQTTQLEKYLEQVTDFVNNSGRMKAKRLQQITQSIDAKQLGPYGGGSYTSLSGRTTVKLEHIEFEDLQEGLNEEKVILGKVVCSVYNEDGVPFTFCLVSKLGTCLAVTVFNLAESRGVIIGDSVAIPEPYVTDVDFKYGNKRFKFRLIRVETPRVMVVNGKKLGKDTQACVQMSIFKKFT
uniref:Tetratricopeptide repeat protein 5 OB fold domain-containing protein n=1 Tax=Photinus pyralis TaxID=7054 RepID=A0A1Y1M5P0_PHOPY